ncbi:MAG: UDP-N-acetylglucosamine 2-epimerase (non-hydrolyzing) [Bdellovibrionales bacterium]|nr:UDP-N-acetylglucosamine 2-epimerase (non-hydrolyzing) [Bdellovibrionales bacterium]
MKKLMFCIGTRPEAIKLAALILESKQRGADVQVLVSGQHHEMLTPFLDFFGIKADHNLQVMKPNQSLSDLTAAILSRAQPVIAGFKPDAVFVQGDTTTTFACSLAAFYEKVRVVHIEAGLRTYDRYSPYPEEMNRKLTTQLADYFFAPTLGSRKNLLLENVHDNVIVTGNTGIDGLRIASEIILKGGKGSMSAKSMDALKDKKKIVLVTCHRRENHGEPLVRICDAISELAHKYPNLYFVIPVHLNPNVKAVIEKRLGSNVQVELLPPLDYPAFVPYLKNSWVILTDSGGVQEEAPYFKKPIFVMRESTERPEGIEAGVGELVGASRDKIVTAISRCIEDPEYYESFQKSVSPYGDGFAAKKILDYLKI